MQKTSLITLLCLIISFFSSVVFAQTPSTKLYVYKLNVQNANEMQNGYIEPDMVTIQAAEAVSETQPEACIDLRKLMLMNYRAENGVMMDGDLAILFNTKITDATKSAIVAKICQVPASTGTCSVRFTEEIYDISDLVINNYFPIEQNSFQRPPTPHSLSGHPMLPRFSPACETGQYEDSFEFAANTPEARNYLSNLNVTIRPLGILSLAKPDGTKIFDFGHPRSR